MNTAHVLKHPVLATAKAAGRATRVGQDSAWAIVTQAVRAATRTNELVVSSVKLLNPFRWVKRCAARCRPEECKPAEAASPAAPRPTGVPYRRGTDVPAQKAVRTRPETGKTVVSTVRRAASIRAPVAAEPKITRSPRRAPARAARPRSTRRTQTPQDVTPAEVSAAVFAGVTEKVMFTRAYKDLDSSNEATRARAARILGGLRHALSGRALSGCLARDSSAEVRKECVNGLTALGMKGHLSAVERALSDDCSGVRLAAVRGMHRLAGPDGAASLIRMFSDVDEDVRRRAAACLGWLGQKHLAVELVPLLRGESASVRLAALEALGNLKSPAVVADVIELLDDPEESVQRKAFQVLETITGKQMGETFPADEGGRQFLIARWRAWQERKPVRRGS